MSVLLCLVGLPGSGKSTLAVDLARSWTETQVDVVEFDAEIPSSAFSAGLYRESRRAVLSRVEDTLSGGGLVILDDNFYYRSMRFAVWRMARRQRAGFFQVFLDRPLTQCITNNAKRTDPVPRDVILTMDRLFERPDPSKHPWETHSVTWTANRPATDLHPYIARAFDVPAPPVLSSSDPLPQSVQHNVDLALRRVVHRVLSELPPSLRSTTAHRLVSLKKSIINSIRDKEILLPEDHTIIGSPISCYEEILFKYIF